MYASYISMHPTPDSELRWIGDHAERTDALNACLTEARRISTSEAPTDIEWTTTPGQRGDIFQASYAGYELRVETNPNTSF